VEKIPMVKVVVGFGKTSNRKMEVKMMKLRHQGKSEVSEFVSLT
jgi:hypothetical protein